VITATALAAEMRKRQQQKTNVVTGLFKKQLDFIMDKNNFKLARCSRRAGKSYACARYLLHVASTVPNANCVYLALTRKSAKRILWNLLKLLAKKHAIEIEPKAADLVIELPNGSSILLMGANDEACAETLRGSPWDLVVIDEVASYSGHLETIVDEVLSPGLMDRNGTVVLIGTPSSDFSSYFYKCDHDKSWSTYHWTVLDNPHVPKAKDWIDTTIKKRGWTLETPFVKREFFGEWCRSEEDQVYSYNPLRNRVDDAPKGLHYVIGVDVGWKDDKAITVVGFNQDKYDKTYVVYKFKKSHMLISELGEKLKELNDKYKPMKIVVDPGGGGVDISAEINNRFGLACVSAKKTAKYDYIEFLNADMVSGKFLNVVEDEDDALEKEYAELQWKEKVKRVEGEQPNHLADATLYAWRECWAYLHEESVPLPTTPEGILESEARRMERQLIEVDLIRKMQQEEEDWL